MNGQPLAPIPTPPFGQVGDGPCKPRLCGGAATCAPGEKEALSGCPELGRPESSTPGTAPFHRGVAAAALGLVNVSECTQPGGPRGSAHVKVTFLPSGVISTSEVDSPPFAGTSVGGCIAGKYRRVRIPAFTGGPVTIGKSFTLQ